MGLTFYHLTSCCCYPRVTRELPGSYPDVIAPKLRQSFIDSHNRPPTTTHALLSPHDELGGSPLLAVSGDIYTRHGCTHHLELLYWLLGLTQGQESAAACMKSAMRMRLLCCLYIRSRYGARCRNWESASSKQGFSSLCSSTYSLLYVTQEG